MDPKERFLLDQAEGDAEKSRHEEAHLERLGVETDLVRAGAEHTRARAALLKAVTGLIGALTFCVAIFLLALIVVWAVQTIRH